MLAVRLLKKHVFVFSCFFAQHRLFLSARFIVWMFLENVCFLYSLVDCLVHSSISMFFERFFFFFLIDSACPVHVSILGG